MGQLFYNGLHWNAGGSNDSPRPQYIAGQQFSTAFVLATGNITAGGCSTGDNGWRDVCTWIRNNTNRTGEIVLRLYWPAGNCVGGDIGPVLGQAFYNQIVQPAIDLFGIRNFQVLNELNLEYEPSKPRSSLSGDMYNMAFWIKRLAVQNNRGAVYLGFPGPGGAAADPGSSAWNAYWNDYSGNITKGTDQGAAYNWLAVHCYEFSSSGLDGRMRGQYNSLRGKFPNYPHRWTEYGIPLDSAGFCSVPCSNPSAFQSRANACKAAIQSFRTWVGQQGGPDVWSVNYYLAFDSNASAQGGADTRYELVLNNSNLGPAQTLASAF